MADPLFESSSPPGSFGKRFLLSDSDSPFDDADVDSTDERFARLAESVQAARADGRDVDAVKLGQTLGLSADEVGRWIATVEWTDEAFAGVVGFAAPDLSNPDLPDDFELIAEIGRGGMGIVYRVRQKSLDREVALKILRPGDLTFGDSIERFRREAQSLARLKHSNIVPVHEVGQIDTHVYFTMDLVDGEALVDRLKRGPLTVALSIRIAQQVASAITHAHSRGVVHRDLKPANILLDEDEAAHVVDFGLARDASHDVSMTASGHLLGTPAYMSPEQARGDSSGVGERSDVYALGAVLYECLTGQPPFPQRNFGELLHAVIHQDPQRPRNLVPSLPVDIERICRKAMAKEPEHRYPTMQAFLQDLEAFQEGRPVRAREPGIIYRTTRWVGRHRKSVAATMILGVSALVASVLTTVHFAQQAPEKLLAEATRLEQSGEHDKARLLRTMATDVSLFVRPDPARLTADERRRLTNARVVLEDGLRFLETDGPRGRDRLESLVKTLRDELADRDISRSRIAHELRWQLTRAQLALGDYDGAERSATQSLIHLPGSIGDSVRDWIVRALTTINHRERVAAAWYVLHRFHPIVFLPLDVDELFQEHPVILAESLITALREEFELIGPLTHSFERYTQNHKAVVYSSGVLDRLYELSGDGTVASRVRGRAVAWLGALANLPAESSYLSARGDLDSDDIARLRRQYEAVRGKSWKDGLLTRLELAMDEWTSPTEWWLRSQLGPQFNGHGGWLKWYRSLVDKGELAQMNAIIDLILEPSGFDPAAGVPTLEAALAAYRSNLTGRRSSLNMLITILLERDGTFDLVPDGRPLDDEFIPWQRLDGPAENFRRTVRVANFDVSLRGGPPVVQWEKTRQLSPGNKATLIHSYDGNAPFRYVFHPPGVPALETEMGARYQAEFELVRGRRDWLIRVPTSRLHEEGITVHGGVDEAILEFPVVIDRPYASGWNPVRREQRLLLMTSEVGDSGSSSSDQWRQHVIDAIRRQLKIAEERTFDGRKLPWESGDSYRGLLTAAVYFPLPELRDELRRLSEESGNPTLANLWLYPARLLAGDPAPLDDATFLERVVKQGPLGGGTEIGASFLIRLLQNVSEPRIQEFALQQLAEWDIGDFAREAVAIALTLKEFTPELRAKADALISRSDSDPRLGSSDWYYASWVGLLLVGGLAAGWVSIRTQSARRRRFFGVLALAAGLFLTSTRMRLFGVWIPPTGIDFLLLFIAARACTGGKGPLARWAQGTVLASFGIWLVGQMTPQFFVLSLLGGFCLPALLVLLSVDGWRRSNRPPFHMMSIVGYAVLAVAVHGNLLWTHIAWGDATPGFHVAQEVNSLSLIWTVVLLFQLLHRAQPPRRLLVGAKPTPQLS